MEASLATVMLGYCCYYSCHTIQSNSHLDRSFGVHKNLNHDANSFRFGDGFDTEHITVLHTENEYVRGAKQLINFDPSGDKFPQHLVTDPMPFHNTIKIQCE
jgi:hypothetical protein